MSRTPRALSILAAGVAGVLSCVPFARAHVELEASLDAFQETPAPKIRVALDIAQERPTPTFTVVVPMDTAQEVPAPTGTDTTTEGSAMLTLNSDRTITYSITVQDLTGPPTLAHIHMGPRGTPGGVVVALDAGTLSGTTGALTDEQLTALAAGLLYVNVHTSMNPAGEIRGQIENLPRGTFEFTFDPVARTITYTTTVADLTGAPALAHIHEGDPGVPGGVAVALSPIDAGTTGALTDDQVTALMAGGLYVNVHTAANGAGEVRGQIVFPKGTVDTLEFDPETNQLEYDITAEGLSGSPTAAHVHMGAPGVPGDVVVGLDTDLAGTVVLPESAVNALYDGGLYLNVHTQLNIGGEIRGQIRIAGTSKCQCVGVKRRDFEKCVKDEIRALDAEERQRKGVKALKKAVKASACGKKRGPKGACCLAQTPDEGIVVGRMCAPAVPRGQCERKGGVFLRRVSCFKDDDGNLRNPCTPAASPSGAFLDGAAAGVL